MIPPEQLIDYRYLNMDSKEFKKSPEELVASVAGSTSYTRTIPNYEFGQVLIAAGINPFSEYDAIKLCRQLSGVTNGRS